jgi:AraC-like DNA-binding protein
MEIFRDRGCVAGYRYENPLADLCSLTHCGEVYCNQDHSVRTHTHEGFEFMYVLSGTAYWQIGDAVYAQNQSELFWTAPEEPHGTARRTHQGYHKLWLGLQLSDLDPEGPRVARALHGLSGQGRHIIADAREMETVLRGLILQVISRKAGCADVCRNYLRTFLSLVEQSTADGGASEAAADDRPICFPVQRAIAFMLHHLHGPVKLEEIAQAAHLSVSQLCLYFRNTVGMTPAAYHRAMRLEAARNMLLQPEISVTQVAMDFGFSSSQHFAMDFRKAFDITPQEWKRGRPAEHGGKSCAPWGRPAEHGGMSCAPWGGMADAGGPGAEELRRTAR